MTGNRAMSLAFFALMLTNTCVIIWAKNMLLVLLWEWIHFLLLAIWWIAWGMFFTQGAYLQIFDYFMAAVCAWVAWVSWDRWNRRRKRRKGMRVAGKIGLRLGRLVIVPEGGPA